MSSFEMRVQLDKNKILFINDYFYEQIIEVIKKLSIEFGLNNMNYQDEELVIFDDDPSTFVKFWSLIFTLHNQEWFKLYVSKWTWFNSELIDKNNPSGLENLKEIIYKNNTLR